MFLSGYVRFVAGGWDRSIGWDSVKLQLTKISDVCIESICDWF